MNPESPSTARSRRRETLARVLAAGALLAAFAWVVVMFFGDDGGRTYKLLFETGGQLVQGNEVLVAGQKVGSIDDLELTDDGQAEISISTDRPLTVGTTAQIRATSLSGIANRYIALQMGPTNEEIPSGSTITADATTSPVDIDQLFSIFDEDTRKALQDVFKGQAAIYAGDPEASREAYKYLAPGLQSTERFLNELSGDQAALSQVLTSGASVLGAVAERRDDLSALTENANSALSAIAAESDSLDRALSVLPPTMRQANTTFVNLRAALDDVDVLVETAKPATKDFAPFLRDLRPFAEKAVPTIDSLETAINTEGPANDLTDVLLLLPGLEDEAAETREDGIAAMDASEPNIEVTRQYSPDLMALVTRLSQVLSYYSGDGHYARTMPVTNIFSYNNGTDQLEPQYSGEGACQQYDFYSPTFNPSDPPALADPDCTQPASPPSSTDFFSSFGFQRCPGTASQPAEDGSTPFDEGFTAPDDCDPNAVVPEDSATAP